MRAKNTDSPMLDELIIGRGDFDDSFARANMSTEIEIAPPASWPSPDQSVYHGISGDFVRVACQSSEADPIAVLGQFLVWFSSICGPRPGMWVGDARHPVREYIVIIGKTAKARKGTSIQPIQRLHEAVCSLMGNANRIIYGSIASGEGLIYAVRDPSPSAAENAESDDQGVVDKRLLIVDEELAGSIKAAMRAGSIASPVLRRAWDSGRLEHPTRRSPLQATDAHICVIGHITLEELTAVLNDTEIYNGMLNRFLWVCARRARIVPIPTAMQSEVLDGFARKMIKIVEHAHQIGDIALSDRARQVWAQMYKNLALPDADGRVAAVTARAEVHILRVALIYALLDSSLQVETEHLVAAHALWTYCDASARYVFESEADPDEMVILAAVASGAKTATQISRLFGGHKSTNKLKELLKRLEANNKIYRYSGSSVNGGKAPTYFASCEKRENAQ